LNGGIKKIVVDSSLKLLSENKIFENCITSKIEHRKSLSVAYDSLPFSALPLKITRSERKKLRTQKRTYREKERQELIRQGLLEPPKPKIRISNLMKIMNNITKEEPTAIETKFRREIAERHQAHEDRNMARQLTPWREK